ncbi:hypothetical protein LAZ67_5002548 [Cordylochernes scorpioides]|uniref:RNA-directed DNA polymerase n=1 Tax=Cordylochernes scorpioides TaxID=51811 RepID=A0ABY6KJF2_9ARAC|nr:hypothetical protein LAZ67_5002548 [Cordylochernes scorpioides]
MRLGMPGLSEKLLIIGLIHGLPPDMQNQLSTEEALLQLLKNIRPSLEKKPFEPKTYQTNGNGLSEPAIRDIKTFLSCYPHFKGEWKKAAVRYHNRSYNYYLGCSPLFKLTKTSTVLPDDKELNLHCPFYETEKGQIEQNLYRQRTKFYFNSRKKALPPGMSIDDYILVRHQKVGNEWKLSGPHRVTRLTKMDGHPKYVEYEPDDKTPNGLPLNWRDVFAAAQPADPTKWIQVALSVEHNRQQSKLRNLFKPKVCTLSQQERSASNCPFFCPICIKKRIKVKHWLNECPDYDPNYKTERSSKNTQPKQFITTVTESTTSNETNKVTCLSTHNPPNKLIDFKICVNKHPLQAFMDTGATISLINQNLMKSLNLHPLIDSPMQIQQANSLTNTLGYVHVDLQIHNKTRKVKLHVIPNLKFQLLIGLDIAEDFELIVDTKDKTVYTKQSAEMALSTSNRYRKNLHSATTTEPDSTTTTTATTTEPDSTTTTATTTTNQIQQQQQQQQQNQLQQQQQNQIQQQHQMQQQQRQQHQRQADLSFIEDPQDHQNTVMVKKRGLLRAVVPASFKEHVLKEYHDNMSHPSMNKTVKLIVPLFWWSDMVQEIKSYVRSCKTCQLTKSSNQPTLGQLIIPDTELQPAQVISADTIVMGTAAEKTKHKYIQVFIDHLTRYVWAFPTIKNTAQATLQCFNRILQVSLPIKHIITDNGKNFNSKEFKRCLKVHNIKQTFTTPYHPQSNGMCEKVNGTIMTKLRTALLDKPKVKWSTLLPKVITDYNNTPHDVTGFPPSFLLFGYNVQPQFADNPSTSVEDARKLAIKRTQHHREISKRRHDSRHPDIEFKVGDLVLKRIPTMIRSAETYAIARSLSSPKELSFVEYDDLIKLLTDHFCPKPNIIVQRFLFNKRNQGEESVSAYVAELRKLSEDCEFMDLEDRLRDRLVCGLRKESIVKRLLSESNLTFEKALNIAICDESASADASVLQEKIT